MKTRKQKETNEKEIHLLEQKGYERMMNEIMPVQQAEVYRKPTKKVVEEAVKEQLFLTTGSQQLQQQTEVTSSLDAYWIPACGILLAVGILLLLQYRKRRQGRWKKNVAHTYNYES